MCGLSGVSVCNKMGLGKRKPKMNIRGKKISRMKKEKIKFSEKHVSAHRNTTKMDT